MTIGTRIRSALSSIYNATWSTLGGLMGLGGYSATDPRRKILPQGMRPQNATANQLLTSSLPQLRAYCRHLERNNPTARAAVEGLVANVVGTGIALEPDTGDPATDLRIRQVWNEYLADCTANGCHDMYYLQSQGIREIVVAGELLWRLVVIPERVSEGKIPLVVLPLEAEWLNERQSTIGHPDKNGVVWVGGVGTNKVGRPVVYQISNPEMPGSEIETLPADQIIHDFERRRALQARGEPWFSPVIEVMQQERDLVDAELKAAVNTASLGLVITSDLQDNLDTTENGTAIDPAQSLRIGGVARMFPGEKVEAFSHQRPGQQIAPFRQMLRGDIAAAMRVPQRFLDRDVGRANYSSMRCDMLDNDKLLAPVREWFGHATIGRVYRAVLPYLAIKAGIKLPKPAYRLIPDGQPYVDPYKDAQAALLAIGGNLSTWEAEVGKKGGDYKAVWKQAAKEKAELEALGLDPDLTGNGAQQQQAPQDTTTQDPAPAVDPASAAPIPIEPRSLVFERNEKGRIVRVGEQ